MKQSPHNLFDSQDGSWEFNGIVFEKQAADLKEKSGALLKETIRVYERSKKLCEYKKGKHNAPTLQK